MNIPWFGPSVGEQEAEQVRKVILSNFINEGKVSEDFCKRLADYVGASYALCVPSATAGLSLSLMAYGIGPGDKVIVPSFTFVATANAVRLAGAEVVLANVCPNRLTLDTEDVVSKIDPSVKAIVAVDVNGRGADYDSLLRISKDNQLALICDSAEALGSKYRGQFLGTFGDAGVFSFSPNKTITTGQGGMIVTNNENTFFRLKELKDQGRRFRGTGGNDLHPVMGFNFKFTDIQAAVGLAQLDKLDARLKKAGLRDQIYLEVLSNTQGVEFPDYSEVGEVRQWTDVFIKERDQLVESLYREKIGCRPFWFPLFEQEPYRKCYEGNHSKIDDISKRGVWLPSHFDSNVGDYQYAARRIKELIR